MAAHYWLFPWVSFFVSLFAAAGGLFLLRTAKKVASESRLPIAYTVVWLIVTAFLVAGALVVGNWGTTDFIPARGVLAGALVGPIIFRILRRSASQSSALSTAIVVGFITAVVSACRLWLTHGEVSGLIAFALSSGLSILVFLLAPNLGDDGLPIRSTATFALSYIGILVSAVLLGFTRAGTLGELFWADIPLLIGASFAAGSFAAVTLDRFGFLARAAIMTLIATLVVIPLGLTVAHSLPLIGLTSLGAILLAAPLLLTVRAQNTTAAVLLGHLLIITGITLAFTLLSGYGIAIFALGVVLVAVIALPGQFKMPAEWLTFLALLLLYRLEVLQNGDSVRAIGMADLWDLLAVGLGILLPRLVAANLPARSDAVLPWPALVQWIATLAIPSLLLDYIWQPRSLTGLFLGLAIGQITSAGPEAADNEVLSATSLLAGLLLFVFLPGLDQIGAPGRNIRIIAIIVVAVLLIISILVPSRRVAAKAS